MAPPGTPIHAFQQRLRRLLEEHCEGRYTVFARAAGIPVTTMQHYLRHAVHLPGGEHLLRMARGFGITMDYLVTGEGPARPAPHRDQPTYLTVPILRCGCPGPCALRADVLPAQPPMPTMVLPAEVIRRRDHRLIAVPITDGLQAAGWLDGSRLVVDLDARTPAPDALALVQVNGHCKVGYINPFLGACLFGPTADGEFEMLLPGTWTVLGTVVAGVVRLGGTDA